MWPVSNRSSGTLKSVWSMMKPRDEAYGSKVGSKWQGHLERIQTLATLFLVSSPTFAAPPYRTDDPEPTDYQHFELYNHSTGVHVSGDTNGFLPAVEFDYGIMPETQLTIVAPMAFDRAVGAPRKWGYGDMDVGVKYRFIDQDKNDWRPSVAAFPTVEIATGDARRGLGTGNTRTLLPVWLLKDIGDWTISGGGDYWINPGSGNRNYWFFGSLLQRKITDQFKIGAEIFHQTADKADGKDSTGFNIGGVYDFTDHYHLVFSVGRGIQHAKETNEFSWYIGFEVTGGDDKP